MRDHDEIEGGLSSAELQQLREHRPADPILEERLVNMMRERGTLRSAAPRSIAQARSRSWLITGVLAAASVALAFFAGMRTGELRAGVRGVTSSSLSTGDSAAVVAQVQRASAAYITALALVQAGDSTGKQMAIDSFRTAADQIIRLAPDSRISFAIQAAFPGSIAVSPARIAQLSRAPRVIYF